jgi:hypothetical protein
MWQNNVSKAKAGSTLQYMTKGKCPPNLPSQPHSLLGNRLHNDLDNPAMHTRKFKLDF